MNANEPRLEARLESWKEIGAYLQRDSTTARRWEKEEGLPVHRHSHKSRSSVYAYASEIDAWRAGRKVAPEPVPPRPLWKIPTFALTMLLCLVMVGNGVRPQIASAQGTQAARQIWSGEGVDDTGSPSFDGRYLSFTDWETGDLAIRDLLSGNQRRLTSNPTRYSDGYSFRPKMSRDGRQIAFSQIKTSGVDLRLIGADGSKLRTLYANREFSYLEPAGFQPDGKAVLTVLNATNEADKIALISVADGSAQFLKTLPWGSLGRVALSPDGRSIAYGFRPQEGKPGTKIMLLAVDGSREVTLSESPSPEQVFGWSPDGKGLLFASERTGTRDLWFLNIADGKTQYDPRRVRRGIGGMRPMGITNMGTLFYTESSSTNEVFTASWDWEAGKLLAQPKPASQKLLGVNRDPAWSPDGSSLAYISQPGDKRSQVITIVKVEHGDERHLSPTLSQIQRLTGWSPDGRELLLMAFDEKNREGAYSVDVQTGAARALAQAERGQTIFQPEWLPSGKAIVYYRRDQTAPPSHVIVHEIESGAERDLPTGLENSAFIDTLLSPDGQRIAFRADAALGVVSVAGGPPRELFRDNVTGGRINLVGWSPNSRQVILETKQRIGLRDVNHELWRISSEGGERTKLASGGLQAAKIRFQLDGHRIAYTVSQGGGMEIWALENFLPTIPAK